MRALRHLILSCLLLLAARGADKEGVVFKQQYRPGHLYHQTTSMSQEMDLDLGAQRMDQRLAMSVGMESRVTPSADGKTKLVALKYDRAVVSVNAQGQKFSYDSNTPDAANSGPLAMFGKVIGKSFNVVFNSNDEVIRVDKLDEALDKLSGADALGASMFRELFDEESVKRMLQQSVLRSPHGRTMRTGEGWPFIHQMKLPGIGKLNVKGQYTFTTMVERNGVSCAEVRAAADIVLDTSEEAGASKESETFAQQMKMKLEQGRLQGTLYYDPAIQFTRELEIEQRMTLTAKIPDGTGKVLRLPMKQVVTMKLDSFAPLPKAVAEPDDE